MSGAALVRRRGDALKERLKPVLVPARDRVRRRLRRLTAQAVLSRTRRCNARSTEPVTGTAAVVVSLTSFGSRIGTVAWAVESIAAGSVRPERLILWLDDPAAVQAPPAALERLRRRGLEILPTPDYGPHKKYFPYVRSLERHVLPLVTADDDILYPRDWLERLVGSHLRSPDQVICYRANRIIVDGERLAPYASWPRCRTTRPSVAHLATGVSGVLYPPALLEELSRRGEAFLDSCPRADDIWLHWVALRTGVPVGQVESRPRHFLAVPGTQDSSLTASNVHEGGNDRQIAAVYGPADVAAITQAAADLA